MESWEHVVRGTRQWLVSLNNPEAKDLLEVHLERVELLIRVTGKMKNDNEQYTDTFVHVGNSLLRVIFLKGSKHALSNTVNKMDYDKRIPEILQPNVKEIKSYLKSLEGNLEKLETRVKNLNEEIDKTESRNFKITEKEDKKLKMMLVDMESDIEMAEVDEEESSKALESFTSDIKSYEEKMKNRAFGNIGLGTILGGVAGAVCTVFAPPIGLLALGGAAAVGGGVGGGVTAYFTYSSCALVFGASVAVLVVGGVLYVEWKRWKATKNLCDKLCSIICDHKNRVNEMRAYITI
ncbi:uncharacterized protein [Montipora capricornis]|uniref:uncharacterized protein n=1 Tax=Montipora capricornis TaxID=246305 RepID=UPI0035F1D529